MTTSNQQEDLFENAFHEWLELHGTELSPMMVGDKFVGHVDVTKLKIATIDLIKAREEIAERKGRQKPVGDAIEWDIDREVMQFVMSKIKLKSKSIASRTLVNEELVDRWRDGTADKYDLNVHIWKLRLLASMTHKYNWAVFLLKPENLPKLSTKNQSRSKARVLSRTLCVA